MVRVGLVGSICFWLGSAFSGWVRSGLVGSGWFRSDPAGSGGVWLGPAGSGQVRSDGFGPPLPVVHRTGSVHRTRGPSEGCPSSTGPLGIRCRQGDLPPFGRSSGRRRVATAADSGESVGQDRRRARGAVRCPSHLLAASARGADSRFSGWFSRSYSFRAWEPWGARWRPGSCLRPACGLRLVSRRGLTSCPRLVSCPGPASCLRLVLCPGPPSGLGLLPRLRLLLRPGAPSRLGLLLRPRPLLSPGAPSCLR